MSALTAPNHYLQQFYAVLTFPYDQGEGWEVKHWPLVLPALIPEEPFYEWALTSHDKTGSSWMFTVFEPGGLQSSYVPGVFRQRHVEKISKASATGKVKVGQEDSPPVSQKTTGSSSFQARLYEQVEAFTQSTRAKILARDIMSSPVVTLPITASVAQAWEVVHAKRFRHIPILGTDDLVIGILSDRDLFRGTMESVLSGTTWSNKQVETPIRNLVSHPVLVASSAAELPAIARVMLEERIGALPIVSEEGSLLGMITRSDILRVLVAHPDFDQWV